MRIRSDGQETRARILAAACHSFSQNGFRKATHEMICHKADANRAAINHHFGDKQSLYRVVWQHLLNAADSEYPVSGNLPEDSPAVERLEAHIRALMYRHFSQGASWQLERLRLLEQVNPTGMVDDILSEHHIRNRKQMLSVLGQLLSGEASAAVIRFYETSLLGLCQGDWSGPQARKSQTLKKAGIGRKRIEVLTGQITQFLLQGIAAKVHESQSR